MPTPGSGGRGCRLVAFAATECEGPGVTTLWPPYLFPFGARVSFEAGESWGALWEEGGSGSRPVPPPPLPGAPRGTTHHGTGGAIGAWGSRKTLFSLKHSRSPYEPPPPPPVPPRATPVPAPPSRASSPLLCPPPARPPATHHRPGDPSQAIRPGLPGGPLGPDGASLPRRTLQAGFPLQVARRTHGAHAGCWSLGPEHCSDLNTPRYAGGGGNFPCSYGSRLHSSISPRGHASC